MRLIFLALASLPLLTACGPDPVDPTTTTDATGPSSTGASMTGSTGTTAGTDTPTTGTAGTTDPTTTSVTTTTTGDTSTTGTTTDPGTSGGPGSAATTDGTDTGPIIEGACEVDADCKLADDCCDCDGVPVDVDVAVCDLECKQSKCSELGIDKAVCRLGVCQTERLSCDAGKVACDALPPPCPPGTVAETTPICWSGKCVPAKNCDVLESCELCPNDHVCVQNIGRGPEPGVVCEPLAAGCDPKKPCDCIGDQVCLDPFGACFNQPGGDISCECINC